MIIRKPVTKISKNPNEKRAEEGGCYVSNFNKWDIKLNGEHVISHDVLYADIEKNEVAFFIRDEDGYPKVENGKPVVELVTDKQVFIGGYVPDCLPCEITEQEERKMQAWWNLP